MHAGGGHADPPPPFNYPNLADDPHKLGGDLGIAEAASPISSRPPATNFDDMVQQEAAAAGSSGNRWPRQETLALLQIRSEMDAAFRDATPKAPLWDQVSRKLGELGYKRSAKKCKEKFENVQKYYKRTKEGRAGRQDGKTYKFFSQLEALDHHLNITSPSSVHPTILPPPPPLSLPPPIPRTDPPSFPPPEPGVIGASASFFSNVGISFSSNTSSEEEDDDEDIADEDLEMESDRPQDRKRKRTADPPPPHHHSVSSDERMMEFFHGLMSKVMEKQEAMQQKFLEAIEKREQDRMIREEAWKRQDMARISREHDLLAQERAISASRDAAIIAFLEKITGQTINLPTTVPIPPPPSPPPPSQNPIHPPQPPKDQLQPQNESLLVSDSPRTAAPAVPEQQQIVALQEAGSSRWPKAEVLALIQLRSGMEYKYQEVGPKGPLWEEVSAGMQRMGYNRNPKRCKEKWENINKYYKKVKESNKKRPEDSKTCPYFHELDALYQRKQHRSSSSAILGSSSDQQQQQQQQQEPPQSEVSGGSKQQPEDMLEKKQEGSSGEDLIDIDCFNTAECSSYSDEDDMMNQEEDDEYYNDGTKDMDMAAAYKIQFQKMNSVGSSSTKGGGGVTAAGSTTTTSFMAMVQ